MHDYPVGTTAYVTFPSNGLRGERRYLAEVRKDFGRPQWFGSWHGFAVDMDRPVKVEPVSVTLLPLDEEGDDAGSGDG